MKKKLSIILTAFIIVLFTNPLSAQSDLKYCGSTEAEQKLIKDHPELLPEIIQSNRILEMQESHYNEQSGRATVYTIPIVFHIIHNYGPENISDQQIFDAVRILNEDFQKLNADTTNVVSAFKSIIGNADIKFKLAQKDPNGNCTNGIIRKVSSETYKGVNEWGNTSTSDVSRWPRDKYLNIWVVNAIESGAAGYTYKPGSVNNSADMDGIVILSNYIGSIGSGTSQRSRALTHEIGHWLNLAHTWGNTNTPADINNCSDDDGVNDTPNSIGWTSCNLSGTSCGSLDNVQNYMDYSYCALMFSAGQATKMRSALTSSVAKRSSLWTTSNLNATGTQDNVDILCKADFSSDRTVICSGESISFEDLSYNGQSTWAWSFPGGDVTTSDIENPSVIYNTPGDYNVSLTVGNGVNSTSTNKTQYITVLPSIGKTGPIQESFESTTSFPNSDWTVENIDGGVTWQITSTAAASGSKSIKLGNLNYTSDQKDALVSSTIDASNFSAINVTFKAAYRTRTSSDTDILRIYLSTNCGKTWTLRSSKNASTLSGGLSQTSNFTPSSSQWKDYTITGIPSSFLVSNLRVKFEFTSGGGNNIYIDDINIFDPSATSISEYTTKIFNIGVYPNPMEETASISFDLIEQNEVKLSIIDMLGRELQVLNNGILGIGEHNFTVSKSTNNLNNGLYFIQLSIDKNTIVKKLMIN